MRNPALGIYSLVFLAVMATLLMGMILGVVVVNEIQLINQIELGG